MLVDLMSMPERVVGTYQDLLKVLEPYMESCGVCEVHLDLHITTGRELNPGVSGEVLLVGGLPKYRKWVYRAYAHRGANSMSHTWRLEHPSY